MVARQVNRGHLNLQSFLNDVDSIDKQLRDPNLIKPAFDVGSGAITNYLLWLILAEMMILNNREVRKNARTNNR